MYCRGPGPLFAPPCFRPCPHAAASYETNVLEYWYNYNNYNTNNTILNINTFNHNKNKNNYKTNNTIFIISNNIIITMGSRHLTLCLP